VKQLVQMPFQFSLSHSTATSSGVQIPQPSNAHRKASAIMKP
jgi:hypothetical protein